MHRGGQIGRIRVPVQDVEGERLASQQVVVDDERPNQIIRAQQVERHHHAGRVHIAHACHAFFQRGDLLLVNENAEIAGFREIDHCDQIGRAGNFWQIGGIIGQPRQIAQSASQRRPPDAITKDIRRIFARQAFDLAQGVKRAFLHIIFELSQGVALGRIDPGKTENRKALRDQIADKGILFPQIQNVKFVDPGRNNQQGNLPHRRSRGRILDQLHQIVLMHDLARCCGDVLADFEGLVIAHLNLGHAVAAFQIGQKVFQPFDQIFALSFGCCAQDFGIGQPEIIGRGGVQKQTRVKFDLLRLLGVDMRGFFLHKTARFVRRRQIRLTHEIEHPVLLPILGFKPFVVFWVLGDRFGLSSLKPG